MSPTVCHPIISPSEVLTTTFPSVSMRKASEFFFLFFFSSWLFFSDSLFCRRKGGKIYKIIITKGKVGWQQFCISIRWWGLVVVIPWAIFSSIVGVFLLGSQRRLAGEKLHTVYITGEVFVLRQRKYQSLVLFLLVIWWAGKYTLLLLWRKITDLQVEVFHYIHETGPFLLQFNCAMILGFCVSEIMCIWLQYYTV